MTDPTPSQPRSRGWVVGRLLGAPVVLQPTTLLLVAVLGYLIWQSGGAGTDAASIGEAALLVVALFGSVFLHELAHAVAARRYERQVHEIVLTLFGGHTSFDARGISPREAAVTAAVGPATNLVIGAVGVAGGFLFPDSWAGSVLAWVGVINIVLGVFNALPGLPMDGGRVLEALVWKATGRRAPGTVTAAWVGRAIAVAVPLWVVGSALSAGRPPAVLSLVWAFLISIMLWTAASQALRVVGVQRRTEAMRARSLMRPAFGMDYEASVAAAVADDRAAPEVHVVVTGADGAAAGHFALASALAVPVDARSDTSLTAVMRPVPRGAEVGLDLEGAELIEAVREWWGKCDALIVTDSGQAVGVIVLEDVARAVSRGR